MFQYASLAFRHPFLKTSWNFITAPELVLKFVEKITDNRWNVWRHVKMQTWTQIYSVSFEEFIWNFVQLQFSLFKHLHETNSGYCSVGSILLLIFFSFYIICLSFIRRTSRFANMEQNYCPYGNTHVANLFENCQLLQVFKK